MGKKSSNPWKILSSKVVYKSSYVRVTEDKVITPEGKGGIHNIVEVGARRGGVCVAAVTEEKHIYLVKQYRYAYGDYTLELINGGIDNSESPLAAAKRELAEEGGFKAKMWRKLGRASAGTETIKNVNHLYLARRLTVIGGTYRGENLMRVVKVPLREAVRMVVAGKIPLSSSALTILLVEKLLGRGK